MCEVVWKASEQSSVEFNANDIDWLRRYINDVYYYFQELTSMTCHKCAARIAYLKRYCYLQRVTTIPWCKHVLQEGLTIERDSLW
jgi:hypothetical protein